MFIYFGTSVSSTGTDIDTRLAKAWTAIDSLSVIWKSDLTDKMKHSFFQAAIESILLYGCTRWTLSKRLEKKLDSNYTRMLRVILNKSWRQLPTKQQLYGHPSRKLSRLDERKDEFKSYVLLWSPSHGRAKAGRPAQTYIQQLCEDTGCSPGDVLEAMNEGLRERVRDIRTDGLIRWWWERRRPLGVVVKAMNSSCEVWTPVALLRSLMDKYPLEMDETSYPPSYGLKNTTNVLLEKWI